nr:hypothetical protein [uncultured Flavobacterium sp.]
MPTNKIIYTKKILENVSFDPKLFSKELKKAVEYLLPYEVEILAKWLVSFVKEKPELYQSLYLIEEV